MRYLALLLLLVVACGEKHKPQKTPNPLEALDQKAERYLGLSSMVQDRFGFLPGCDSLLFTSLYKLGGAAVDIKQARDADGKWHRHPARNCFPKESRTEISRDMWLGAMLVAWFTRDLAMAQSMVNYVETHDKLGASDGSIDGNNRVSTNPQFEGLLYRLRYKLGGSYHGKVETPQTWLPADGFEQSLQMLRLFLVADMNGSVSQIMLNTLRAETNNRPDNAVFWALRAKYDPELAGDQENALRILADEQLFPTDTLPTTSNRCVEYLFHHEKNDDDWLPCPEKALVHSGTDLLFARFVIKHSGTVGFRVRE